MTHRDDELVERIFDTTVNPPGHKPGAAEPAFDTDALAMIRKHLQGEEGDHDQLTHGRKGVGLAETDDAENELEFAAKAWSRRVRAGDPTKTKETVMKRVGINLQKAGISAQTAAAFSKEMLPHVLEGVEGRGKNPHEAVASMLVKSWAISSSGSNPVSLAVQIAAARKFGMDDSIPWAKYANEVGEGSLDRAQGWVNDARFGPILDAYVETVYADTQAFLEKKFPGEDSFLMTRGMKWEEDGMVPPFEQYAEDNDLYRVLGPIKLDSNPLTSFSFNYESAERFTGNRGPSGQGSAMLTGWVPRERIFSVPRTGPGCVAEQEAVLVGGEDVWNVAYSRGKVTRYNLFEAMENPQEDLVARLDEEPEKIAAASNLPSIDEGRNADWVKELTDDTLTKAPGIDEGGDEPHAGYRLGSPPSAQQAGRWKVPGDDDDEV